MATPREGLLFLYRNKNLKGDKKMDSNNNNFDENNFDNGLNVQKAATPSLFKMVVIVVAVIVVLGIVGYLICEKSSGADAKNKDTASSARDRLVLDELTTNRKIIHNSDDIHLTGKGVEKTKSGYVLHFKVVNDTGKNIVLCFDNFIIEGLKVDPSRHTIASGFDGVVDVELESGEVTAEDIKSASSISFDYSVLDADTNSEITSGGFSISR